jgi:hypothetical protein
MPVRTVLQIRLTKEEKDRMEWAAQQGGETLSAWLRRLAREDYELKLAEDAEAQERQAHREEVLQQAFPQPAKKCRHVAMGQFCYVCREKRFG